MIPTADKTAYQAQLFSNRIAKRFKHLKKWANRTGVTCFRIYDKDIPEIPLAADFYRLIPDGKSDGNPVHWLLLFLYERPYEKDPAEEHLWLEAMKAAAAVVLEIPENHIILKTRRRQRGTDTQYEKETGSGQETVQGTVLEQGLYFSVNLTDYLDTGLFFDHRPLRQHIKETCSGKSVLNLFCYTGSFSVYAAAGNAASVVSVDLSKTYLNRAQENFLLNGLSVDAPFLFIRSDVTAFLSTTDRKWDIIILDPPTFSNSKKTPDILDINRDWVSLAGRCIELLEPGGILYFSTNSRHLAFDGTKLHPFAPGQTLSVTDITGRTIPEDFRNSKIHRCWSIRKGTPE